MSHDEQQSTETDDCSWLEFTIPTDWLEHACSLSGGKLVQVALAIWMKAARTKKSRFNLTSADLALFSVDKNVKLNSLIRLEEAGLICMERHVGRCPIITLIR